MFPRDEFDLLLVENDAIQMWIARLERPIRLPVFLEKAVEEPRLSVAILDDAHLPEHDDVRRRAPNCRRMDGRGAPAPSRPPRSRRVDVIPLLSFS